MGNPKGLADEARTSLKRPKAGFLEKDRDAGRGRVLDIGAHKHPGRQDHSPHWGEGDLDPTRLRSNVTIECTRSGTDGEIPGGRPPGRPRVFDRRGVH